VKATAKMADTGLAHNTHIAYKYIDDAVVLAFYYCTPSFKSAPIGFFYSRVSDKPFTVPVYRNDGLCSKKYSTNQ